MSEFRWEILDRVATVSAALEAAEILGDDYLAEVHRGRLDTLRRLAAEHDIHISQAV
jgi:hypothetical protein